MIVRVLIVEDERDVADLILRALKEASWAVDLVGSGTKALEALALADYDLAVLDLGLPDIDGFEVCRRWRARGGKTPILMLTARGALSARVAGLDAGADDYLTKPFAIEELLARMRALARRPAVALAPILTLDDLELDPASRAVRRGGKPVALTTREFALLDYLLRNTGRAVSRAAGLPYHDRLLALPGFLRGPDGRSAPEAGDIAAGFALTGHFLARNIFEPRGEAGALAARAAYLAEVAKAAALSAPP